MLEFVQKNCSEQNEKLKEFKTVLKISGTTLNIDCRSPREEKEKGLKKYLKRL